MKKLIIGIIVVVLLLFTIWLIRPSNNSFREIKIDSKSNVYNKSSLSYIDTILYVGLDKMKIDSITVVIKDIDINRDMGNGIDLRGYIINRGKQYILYISKMDRVEAIKVISHEIIHINQYDSGRLIDGGKFIIWGSDTIMKDELGGINYFERGWEVEAFSRQDSLIKVIGEELNRK